MRFWKTPEIDLWKVSGPLEGPLQVLDNWMFPYYMFSQVEPIYEA